MTFSLWSRRGCWESNFVENWNLWVTRIPMIDGLLFLSTKNLGWSLGPGVCFLFCFRLERGTDPIRQVHAPILDSAGRAGPGVLRHRIHGRVPTTAGTFLCLHNHQWDVGRTRFLLSLHQQWKGKTRHTSNLSGFGSISLRFPLTID